MARQFGGFNPGRRQDRMRTSIIVSVLLCILFGSVGAMFVLTPEHDQVKTVEVVKEAKLDTIDVVIPNKQIEAGTALEPTMFRVESRPKVGLSPRVLTAMDQVQGYYARTVLISDQPLIAEAVTKVKPSSAITTLIPEGFRAVTIRVDARSSVEGWARGGARVDVVWASVVRGQQAVMTIVENAKVLSAERVLENNQIPGQPGGAGEGGVPNTVTLLVSAEDAQKIQLASTTGTLSLSLRGDKDPSSARQSNPITVDVLLGKSSDTNEKIGRSEGTIRIRRPDGGFDEFVVQDGRMVPAPK